MVSVIGPHTVLLADRPAVSHNGLARGVLQAMPAVEGLVRIESSTPEKRRVDARPHRVNVRKMAEDQDALAAIGQRAGQRRATIVGQSPGGAPGGRGRGG